MNTELAVIDGGAVTPMQLLQIATAKGADLAQLEKLMELQERWEANEARKAFVSAMTSFKANPPNIDKNKQVRFETSKGITEYRHATLDHVCDAVGDALSKVDITHHWETEQAEGGMVRVTCVLTHKMGHAQRTTLSAGLDQSGGKNNIQALGSVVSYLQRYTLKAAVGLAESNADDDGSGGTKDENEEIVPDPEGRMKLESCASLGSLAEAWRALTPAQRKTLAGIKEACKTAIQAADKAAA